MKVLVTYMIFFFGRSGAQKRGGGGARANRRPPPKSEMLLLGAIFEKKIWKLALSAPLWIFPFLRPCGRWNALISYEYSAIGEMVKGRLTPHPHPHPLTTREGGGLCTPPPVTLGSKITSLHTIHPKHLWIWCISYKIRIHLFTKSKKMVEVIGMVCTNDF